jgi:UDP-3-O-[3-hydroxymyristoyl] glucosamine N-acyltransferase
MQVTLGELAALVGGQLVGSGDMVIGGAAPLADAGPGDITLVDAAEKCDTLASCHATAVVAPRSFIPKGISAIQVDDVHRAFARIVARFRPARAKARRGTSPLAVVSPTARLGSDVEVHAYATIGDDVEIGDGSTIHSGVQIMDGVRIGPHVTIFSNAVIYENVVVGPRCIIHANAVLGAYGFGYTFQDGKHQLSAQLGNVVLGADVEVGAGTTIDRGTYGSTVVGEGTKIDNLVMIAHNCRIGRHNMICSQVGIAGSTTTGDYVVMAGQVGIKDHVHVGTGAILGAMAGIIGDVAEGARMVGIPATPEREQKLKQVAWIKLPEMRRDFKHMQADVARLSRDLEAIKQDIATRRGAGEDDDSPQRRAVA